jgi:hypothetical protein
LGGDPLAQLWGRNSERDLGGRGDSIARGAELDRRHGAPARVALGRVTFAGAPFPHAKQVQLSCAPHPNESGSAADNNVTCTGHFNVPAAIAAQMAARAAAYPIAWGAEDQDASWLQPARLLLYLHMPAPNIAFPVSLSLNETAVPRLEAFETRVPNSGRFNGYYFDVSAAAAAAPGTSDNAVQLELPGSVAKQMVGLFFENVEPVVTVSHNLSSGLLVG